MVTLYNGDREMIVDPDEVKDFVSQGWSKTKGSKPKVEKIAEEVAEEPVGDPVLQEEEEVVEEVKVSSKKKKGTKNRFV